MKRLPPFAVVVVLGWLLVINGLYYWRVLKVVAPLWRRVFPFGF